MNNTAEATMIKAQNMLRSMGLRARASVFHGYVIPSNISSGKLALHDEARHDAETLVPSDDLSNIWILQVAENGYLPATNRVPGAHEIMVTPRFTPVTEDGHETGDDELVGYTLSETYLIRDENGLRVFTDSHDIGLDLDAHMPMILTKLTDIENVPVEKIKEAH